MQNARSLVIFAALTAVATLVAGCTSGEDIVAIQGAKQLTDSGPYIPPGVPLCVPGTYKGCIQSDADAGAQAFNWATISFALIPTDTTGEFSATLKQPAQVLGVTNTSAIFSANLSSSSYCQGGLISVGMDKGVYQITPQSRINFTGSINGTYYPDDDTNSGGGRFEGTWHAMADGIASLTFRGSWRADWVGPSDGSVDAGVTPPAGCLSPH
jgi:hypothetical protein